VEEAVRDAVERTVQATIGSAQDSRTRAQQAVDEIVKSAEAGATAVRERVRGALEGQRPATQDDLRELQKELRAIARRLDAIEKRLPKPRSSSGSRKKS
jgi:polyhydroxyalkanoate synthesis regulator phasin